MEITQSERAQQIKIKKALIQMCQGELESSYKEFTKMKATPKSLRTVEEQENVEYYSKHIEWLRKEYAAEMKELRSMKWEFKAYQALASGNKYMFHKYMFYMLMTLA